MLQSSRWVLGALVSLAFVVPTVACSPSAPASPSASTSPGATAEGVAEASEGFSVRTEVVGTGEDAVLVTTVTPTDGFKLNLEYPRWNVSVADDAPVAAGAAVSRDAADEFTEDIAIFRIPVTSCPTEGQVAGTLRLSVCNDEACLTPTETVAWNLAERR
jgi:hypothetical protein